MNAQEITYRLVQGSDNINRMRDIVKRVVTMVTDHAISSVLGGSADLPRCIEHVFESDTCIWEIRYMRFISPGDEYKPGYTSGVSGRVKEKHGVFLAFDTRPGSVPFEMEFVQRVYDGLPTFVQGMMEIFPDIQKEWKPLIDASYVRFGPPAIEVV